MSPCDKYEKDITVIFMDQDHGSDRGGETPTKIDGNDDRKTDDYQKWKLKIKERDRDSKMTEKNLSCCDYSYNPGY